VAKAATRSMKNWRERVGVVDQRLDGLELGGGLLGVDIAQGAEDAAREYGRRQRSTNYEFCAGGVCLRCGIIDLPAGVSLGALFVHIVNDTHDARTLPTGVEHLADGIPVWPIGISSKEVSEGLVDHDNAFAFGSVVPGKVASAQACAHSAQISRCDDIDQWAAGTLSGGLTPLGNGVPHSRFWPRGR